MTLFYKGRSTEASGASRLLRVKDRLLRDWGPGCSVVFLVLLVTWLKPCDLQDSTSLPTSQLLSSLVALYLSREASSRDVGLLLRGWFLLMIANNVLI